MIQRPDPIGDLRRSEDINEIYDILDETWVGTPESTAVQPEIVELCRVLEDF